MIKAGHQTERLFNMCCTKTHEPLVGNTPATGLKCDVREVNGTVEMGMDVDLNDVVDGVDEDVSTVTGDGGTFITFRRKSYQPIVLAP